MLSKVAFSATIGGVSALKPYLTNSNCLSTATDGTNKCTGIASGTAGFDAATGTGAMCDHVFRGATTSTAANIPEYYLPGSFGVYNTLSDLTLGMSKSVVCDTDVAGATRGSVQHPSATKCTSVYDSSAPSSFPYYSTKTGYYRNTIA